MSYQQILADFLRENRERFSAFGDMSEAQVRQYIIDPVLEKLGWDTQKFPNPEVIPEYPLRGGTNADYACLIDSRPHVIIEAKAAGRQIGGSDLDQLFRYIWESGATLAALTNGKEWHVYLTFVPLEQERKPVSNINLAEIDSDKAASILWSYLSRDRIVSGKAVKDAREKIAADAKIDKARKAIPGAWNKLIEEEGSIVVETLIEKTAADSGSSPDREDVLEFLKELRPGSRTAPPPSPISPQPARPTQLPQPPSGGRAISYILLGEQKHARHANDAYFQIISALTERNPTFGEQFASQINRRSVHLAQQEIDIPVLRSGTRHAKQTPSGWWLNLTVNNLQKTKHLKIACEVAGIRFGTNLKISLSTA